MISILPKQSIIKKRKGFSLGELLVAISIITIMSTVIIVGLTDLLPYWRISGGTKQLMADLAEAQSYSVSQQVIHKVSLGLNSSNYQIIKEGTGGDQIIKTVNLPAGVEISALSPNVIDNIIKFNFFGTPLDAQDQPLGTVQITLDNNRGRTATIEISSAGHIKAD
jgi:prepilin-type N-terminal cleavage/methylation domain-containing protein